MEQGRGFEVDRGLPLARALVAESSGQLDTSRLLAVVTRGRLLTRFLRPRAARVTMKPSAL